MDRIRDIEISPKNYGVAVALSMIFGVAGIHHFYLGNWLHGLLDFGLLVLTIICLSSSSSATILLGVVFGLIDIIHTIIVTYQLFVGKCSDGEGRLVVYPGQLG